MKQFNYTTWTKEEGSREDSMWAESEEEVLAKLKRQNTLILQISEMKRKEGLRTWSVQSIMEFSHRMALLLSAGIPLRRIMQIVVTQKHKGIPYMEINEGIQRGKSLSTILGELSFPRVGLALIEAGELSGNLGEALELVESYYKKEKKWKKDLQGALAYPTFLGVTLLGFIVVALVFILPQFKKVFLSMNVALPPLTKALFSLGNVLQHFGIYILVFMVAIGIFLYGAYKGSKVRQKVHQYVWNWGMQYAMFQSFYLWRHLKVWSILLNSGLTILEVLKITTDLWGNVYASHCQDEVTLCIEQGKGFTESLEKVGLGTPFMWDLLKIGEETGELVMMLNHGSQYYEALLEHYFHRIQQLLEPIMITCMGLVVAVLVIAVMMPMFNAVTALQNI